MKDGPLIGRENPSLSDSRSMMEGHVMGRSREPPILVICGLADSKSSEVVIVFAHESIKEILSHKPLGADIKDTEKPSFQSCQISQAFVCPCPTFSGTPSPVPQTPRTHQIDPGEACLSSGPKA